MRAIEYRYVSCFDKASEALVKEIPLHGVRVWLLREIFDVAEDDPMFGSWPIGESQAKALMRYLDEPIELNAYDCFLDCSGVWVNEARSLRVVSKDGTQQNEVALHGIDLETLQRILGAEEDDPLHDEVALSAEQIRLLEPFVTSPVKLEGYSCWLSCRIEEVDLARLKPEERPKSQPKHGYYLPPRELPALWNARRSKPKTPAGADDSDG